MNENGQLLLYDIIFSVLILFIVIVAMTNILSQEEDFNEDYAEALETLTLLSSTEVHGQNLLEALSNNDSQSGQVTRELLSGKSYSLKDLTLAKDLSYNYSSNYDEVISARKIVKNHEYELKIYI